MLLPEEWRRLETATEAGSDRYGMTSDERLLLYGTAIQTGLRSNELRSLTRGRLFCDADPPYITCKAGSTKNRKAAQQYIQPELAANLIAHIATTAPVAPIFKLPHESRLASMLREDLVEARKVWLTEAKDDPQEYAQRQQSDFLADTNHEGEITDFHSLRHTCGAWLAMTGAHPKVVQTVMRHESITLTMDTYGHLFPGQAADAVGRLRSMLTNTDPPVPTDAMRATGTDDLPIDDPEIAQRTAQRAGRETWQSTATGCDRQSESDAQKKSPKPLQIADLGDCVQEEALASASSGGGTRTPDTRIMNPLPQARRPGNHHHR